MLAEIDKLLSSKIDNFKVSMADKQQNIADEQISKIQELQNMFDYKFKRRSTDDEHKTNLKVRSKLIEAKIELLKEDVYTKKHHQRKGLAYERYRNLKHQIKIHYISRFFQIGMKSCQRIRGTYSS